jgi:hypothetical protein
MNIALGNPMCCTFQCKHLVDGVLTLFNPTIVICSWINPNSIEDAQTYGGSADRDSFLTRLSTGIYQAIYVSNVVGNWKVSPYWSYTSGGVTLTYRSTVPGNFKVLANTFAFIDTPP